MPGMDLDDLDRSDIRLAALLGRREERGTGGRLLGVLAVLVLAIAAIVTYRIVSILLEGRRGERDAQRQLARVAANETRTGSPAVAGPQGAEDGTGSHASDVGDDLKIIEGIGPRFESVLKAAGIRTFAELADTGPHRIETILRESGGRMADPTTWPAQARLAADGSWQELSELQSMLKGGRQAR